MSKESSKSSKLSNGAERPIDRPIDQSVLLRAAEYVKNYSVLIEPEKNLGFVGRSMEMPFVFGEGKTPEECFEDTREAMAVTVATLLENGEEPPVPAKEKLRTEQINLRLTLHEKLLIEEAARQKGFRGISDFIRTTVLACQGPILGTTRIHRLSVSK